MLAGWRRWTSRPPRVDARQLERYSPTVLAMYREVTLRFTTWLHFLRVLLSTAEDWDDVVVEYLNAVDLSFENLGTGHLLRILRLVKRTTPPHS